MERRRTVAMPCKGWRVTGTVWAGARGAAQSWAQGVDIAGQTPRGGVEDCRS